MTDDFEAVRRLRPDPEGSEGPSAPGVLGRQKDNLIADIADPSGAGAEMRRDPAMYPRLAYLDEVAALEYLCRVFDFSERREARMGAGRTPCWPGSTSGTAWS